MPTSTKKRSLGNPAVVAASTAVGAKAGSIVEKQAEIAKEGIKLIPFFVKTAIVCGVGYYAYNKIFKGFQKAAYNPNWPAANLSDAQAQARANAIYEAMYGVGANVNAVAAQLAGLNYNGWIKVYNAFGNRDGANPLGGEMNLVEWIQDQFNQSQLNQLRFILPGVF